MLNHLRDVLATLIDAYPAGAIVAFDLDQRFVFAGGGGLGPAGLNPDHLVGATPVEAFGDEVGSLVAELYARCLVGERFEEVMHYAARTYRVQHAPIRNGAGVIIGGLAITVDETEQMATRAAQATATARYEALMRAFPGAAFLFDEDGQYLIAGGSHLGVFGHDGEALVGRTPTEVLGEERGGWVEGQIRQALEHGSVVLDVNTTLGRTYELRFVRVEGADGQPPSVLALAVDVHEERQARQRTERDLAEKEALLREVHHRVKNHLQVVQSLLGMTSRRVRSPVAREALADVRDRVRSMAVVHSELYRHPGGDSLRLDVFLGRLLTQLRQSLPALGAVDLHTRLEPVQTDNTVALQLGLVLTELVSNAAEHAFSGQGGQHLQVELTLAEQALHLRVRDDGPGLPDQIAADSSLGLWLVRTLVEPRGGRVQETGGQDGACWDIEVPWTPDGVAGPDGEE